MGTGIAEVINNGAAKTAAQLSAPNTTAATATTPNAAPSQTLITPVAPPARASLYFQHMRTGVQLTPPLYVDMRYRWARLTGMNWLECTQASVFAWAQKTGWKNGAVYYESVPLNTAADVVLFQQAVYPPDMPLLSLNEVGNLSFWDFPPSGATGRSFIDWGGFLQGYNVDGSPSGSNISYMAQGVDWLATYIQYWINNYLKTPYDVTAAIPYGYNYFDQMRLYDANETDMVQFLSLVNFLKVPVGTKTFFDDVLNAAPTIVAGLVSVATLGIGTPLLALTLASVALKVAQSNLNKTEVAPAANLTAFNQQVVNAPANVNTAAEAETIAEATGNNILNAAKANPILYIAIAIVVILIIVYMAKHNANGN